MKPSVNSQADKLAQPARLAKPQNSPKPPSTPRWMGVSKRPRLCLRCHAGGFESNGQATSGNKRVSRRGLSEGTAKGSGRVLAVLGPLLRSAPGMHPDRTEIAEGAPVYLFVEELVALHQSLCSGAFSHRLQSQPWPPPKKKKNIYIYIYIYLFTFPTTRGTAHSAHVSITSIRQR